MEQKASNKTGVELTKKGVALNGRYTVLLCGSLFYFRLPRSVWKDRIAKVKQAGYNCVDVYFPWNYHEKKDGGFDFEGDRDVRYFLDELQKAGIYVIARPGPYICSEWNGGGLPARILESGMPIRCADERFIAEVKKWYDAILPVIAPYAGGGGNIILLQLENELDFFDCSDPEAYIGELVKLAEKHCPDVPYFCCAGQYEIARAGGFTKGAHATLNCYPDSADNTFDAELWAYARALGERNKPLLVSETNRDHFLLRRELSCGAKLLGAYNQVAGMNFGYSQAVNNWGSPDAFLATMYDFGSMIDCAGNFRKEAKQALLFAAFLRTAGEAMGGAIPSEETVEPKKCEFKTAAGGLRVLELDGGGYAVCVPNFDKKAGEIEFEFRGHPVKSTVKAMSAPFFVFDCPLSRYGIEGTIIRADGELISASANELVFNGASEVCLDLGSGEKIFTRGGECGGVKIRFVHGAEALQVAARTAGTGKVPEVKPYRKEKIENPRIAEAPEFGVLKNASGVTFGELGVSEGSLEYAVKIPSGRALYVEEPCDMLRADADGERGETKFASGRDEIIPPTKSGEYTVTVTKWGHSNFDDSQSPSLRISCKKGVRSFGYVEADEKIGRCDFRLLDGYGADTLELGGEIPVRIGTDKWNSTRKPVICSYTTAAKRRADRLILKTDERAEISVYIDGRKVGECDYGKFDLTPYLEKGETKALTLVYRKRVWTQDCGEARLLHVADAKPHRISVLSEKEILGIKGAGAAVTLPCKCSEPVALNARVKTGRECRIKFYGKNVLVTAVADGKVLGRAFAGWTHAPALHGGNPDELYLAKDGSGDLYLYIEPLGKGARLDGAEILYVC